MESAYFTFIFAFSALIEFFISGMCKQKLNLFLFYYKILVKYFSHQKAPSQRIFLVRSKTSRSRVSIFRLFYNIES